MTENSINAFIQTEELSQSHEKQILEVLKIEGNQSRFEVGRKINLDDVNAQKRLSDLYNKDLIEITGSRKHFNCQVSLYSLKVKPDQLEIFSKKNKPTLRKWLKERYPNIHNEFEKEFS